MGSTGCISPFVSLNTIDVDQTMEQFPTISCSSCARNENDPIIFMPLVYGQIKYIRYIIPLNVYRRSQDSALLAVKERI